MKNKRLLKSLSLINEQYVKEAEPKMKASKFSLTRLLGAAACFVLIIALSLYLFIPFDNSPPTLTAYEGSEYFPLIEAIADYRFEPNPHKNNFQAIVAGVGEFFDGFGMLKGDADFAPEDNMSSAPELDADGSNGSYVESTDNQVAGVIEADIVKMSDKYIFRLGRGSLRIYSIDKENTRPVSSIKIPNLPDEIASYKYNNNTEMYLSKDCNTVTVIKWYNDASYRSKVGIISLDVGDVTDVKVKNTVSIDGSYSSSRMVDGKLLLISEYFFKSSEVEYDKPETFVPTVSKNGVEKCVEFEDIIFPEKITNTRYSVVSLFDENTLDILGANALLNFNGAIYVSENNVYVAREYTDIVYLSESDHSYYRMTKSEIAVLGYSGQALDMVGTATVEGSIKDQYSMDEKDGHIRVVTSTNDYGYSPNKDENEQIVDIIGDKRASASLTVVKLDGLKIIAEIKDFAPEGEEAVSVRFDGDNAYVCTAIIVTFTDPVYFFNLADYSNITYTDTGVIDGFSSSLIQLGDGFLLGIGEENWQYGKVEVYEEGIDGVESVDKYLFEGQYSTEYKSYLINRDKDMFGFGVTYFYNQATDKYEHRYILLAFNGYEIVEVLSVEITDNDPSRLRAALIDDYLYITNDEDITVVPLFSQ